MDESTELCPEDRIQALVDILGFDGQRGESQLHVLIRDHPGDPRLQFMKGSLLAASGNYSGGIAAIRHAVDLAPDYGIARFQLGLLLLTCGEAHAAQEAWGPLHGLADDNYLRVFVQGLTSLIHDRFADAVRWLKQGIALNSENLPLNRDIQLIVDETQQRLGPADGNADALSSVHLLLQQAAMKTTKH